MWRLVIVLLLTMCAETSLAADVTNSLPYCYNYACQTKVMLWLSHNQWFSLQTLFSSVTNPSEERQAISSAVGLLNLYAGKVLPVWIDRGGNRNDPDEEGKMDCLDHSHNTQQLLLALYQRGWLRFHQPQAPQRRMPHVLDEHWAMTLKDRITEQIWVVDAWPYDHGHPAAVTLFSVWQEGFDPDE